MFSSKLSKDKSHKLPTISENVSREAKQGKLNETSQQTESTPPEQGDAKFNNVITEESISQSDPSNNFDYPRSSNDLNKDQHSGNEELEDKEESNFPEFSNKRIILQRFTIYNSRSTMYIVGSNTKENLFRVLEIGKDESNDDFLTIIEDKSYFYTRKDMVELINGLNESIEGGIYKIAQGYGLLGFIKFTKGYYLSLITKCSQVAILGGHFVYHIDETKLVPLDINYKRPRKYSDEERLLSIFKYLDLGKTFYFSYSYDITNTLQDNFIISKKLATEYKENGRKDQDYYKTMREHKFEPNERFVWNKLLFQPVLKNSDILTYEWFQPIIHGFIDQASISIYGKKIYITIIARRSHHFAGARFLKRGVNDKGNVANEVETEQIVSDMLVTPFHDPKYGFFNNSRYTSFVQHRGSIPLYWTQDLNRLPKPPIEINLKDPYYQSSAIHFNNLLERYGSPIVVLNLIKTKEKQPRESKLNQHFTDCITYLNQFLPDKYKIDYHCFDMSKHSRKNLDVIGPIQKIASSAIQKIGFFHNGPDLDSMQIQKGIIRTNCIDCLDRTNAAQFIICKEALSYQLASLHLIPPSTSLSYDSDLINILTEIFHDHGDTIAVQYGGSNLVNTMDSYRRINQWSSHTRDILNSIKRIYSNSFMDSIRQEAINLFLGNYVYDETKSKLWELQNDYYLHNEIGIKDLRIKPSYTQWYNSHTIKNEKLLLASCNEQSQSRSNSAYKLEPYPDYNDNWYNECYVPRKFQSLNELFQYNMNSNARYFPTISNDLKNSFDYSPFLTRKPILNSPIKEHQHISEPLTQSSASTLPSVSDASKADVASLPKDDPEKNEISFSNSLYEKENVNTVDTKFANRGPNSSNYLQLTNPYKIKTFLAHKIEKLGYNSKKNTKLSSDINTFNNDNVSDIISYNTTTTYPTYFGVHHQQLQITVQDKDQNLYKKQTDLNQDTLQKIQNTDHLKFNVQNIQVSSKDAVSYEFYVKRTKPTSNYNATNSSSNYQPIQATTKAQDVSLYLQYIGLETLNPLQLNTSDNYFG